MRGRTGTQGCVENRPVRYASKLGPKSNCLGDNIVEVRRLLREGKTDAEIGAVFGLKARAVNRFIKQRRLVRPFGYRMRRL